MSQRLLLVVTILTGLASPAFADSVFTTKPDDPRAVTLAAPDFAVAANGTTDDTAAIQAAIDKAAGPGTGGIVFLPAGRYRLSRTVYVWRGVRVIGYGATRPVFVLGANTPGYQQGLGLMVMFTHAGAPAGAGRPAGGPGAGRGAGRGGVPPRIPFPPPGQVPPNENIPDSGPSTFYSGMSNVDFEIGDGNPAAVAIRAHFAQHGVLSHMDFHTGSGLAALTQIGNEAEDLRFYGGRYGILTDNTSPYWQFTLLDSVFDGQRDAAIREHQAGLTLVRDTFRNVPVAIDIDATYSDQLWVKDSRFEHISRAVVIVSNEKNPQTEIGFQNATCTDVPVFARFRESGATRAGTGSTYRVANFTHGIVLSGLETIGQFKTVYEAAPLATLPAALPAALPALPATESWTNVRTLGVKGDGVADDTEAIRKAIETHRVLYFPIGFYVVRDTITLKPDTVVIALHPNLTHFDLPDATPGYQGVGTPKALLEAPQGGTNILSGLGLNTGGVNPRSTAVLWMAGERSLLYDIQIHGIGGTFMPPAVRAALYPPGRAGAPFASGRWGAKYPSIWVTHGGGGSFANIWTPDTFAQGGFYVSDTTTPGHVYELSNEHHLYNEIKLDHVENWDFNAPQTEEEAQSSPEAVSFEIAWSKNITIANYHGYRVTRTHAPFVAAVRLYNSSDIHFRNVHIKAESGFGTCDDNGCGTFLRVSKYPYENSVEDVTHHLQVREREFASLDVPARPVPPTPADASVVLTAGAKLEKLQDGFFAISGATVDASGTLYFVDHHQQRIFSWSRTDGLNVVRHAPLDAVNLAFDKSGHLMVVSSAGPEGTVYSFDPRAPDDRLTILPLQASTPHPDASVAIPINVWDNGEFADQLDLKTYEYKTLAQMFAEDMTKPKAKEYVSPDGSLFLPAPRVFRQPANDSYPGMDDTGWRWSNNLNTHGFLTARAGSHIYLASSAEDRTYSATVDANGALRDLKLFAERGGESVAVDAKGRVYVANGQVFVYDPAGRLIGRIDVPERPIQILFGGPDRRTLFILCHHSLYAAAPR